MHKDQLDEFELNVPDGQKPRIAKSPSPRARSGFFSLLTHPVEVDRKSKQQDMSDKPYTSSLKGSEKTNEQN